MHLVDGGVDHLFDIDTGRGHGQQANGGENAEASADIVGDDEHLVALVHGVVVQCAFVRVSGDINALFRRVAAVFALQQALCDPEAEGRLQRASGLRNHVDGEILVAEDGAQLVDAVRGEGVAEEIDLRFAGHLVMAGGAEQLDGSTGAEIAAAGSHHQQGLTLAADVLGRGYDTLELSVLHPLGQIQPAGEVASGAAAPREDPMGLGGSGIIGTAVGEKLFGSGKINFDHFCYLLSSGRRCPRYLDIFYL